MQLITDRGETLPIDTWVLAYWPDGSVKWNGIAGVIPGNTDKLLLKKVGKITKGRANAKIVDDNSGKSSIAIDETPQNIRIGTGLISAYIPRQENF